MSIEKESQLSMQDVGTVAQTIKAYMETQTTFIVPQKVYHHTFKPTFFALFTDNALVEAEKNSFEIAQGT